MPHEQDTHHPTHTARLEESVQLVMQEPTAPSPVPLQRGEQGKATRLYGTVTARYKFCHQGQHRCWGIFAFIPVKLCYMETRIQLKLSWKYSAFLSLLLLNSTESKHARCTRNFPKVFEMHRLIPQRVHWSPHPQKKGKPNLNQQLSFSSALFLRRGLCVPQPCMDLS